MIVLNFIWVIIFAFTSEYLRTYFPLSKMMKAKQQQKKKTKVAEAKQETGDKLTKKYEFAKSEKVIELLYKNDDLEEKKKDIEKNRIEGEKFNNQDQYAIYAKMQRSLLKMQKFVKINETELREAYANLPLSGREEYDYISSGKFEEKPVITEQVIEPVETGIFAYIDKMQLILTVTFYVIFYIIPLFVLPMFLGPIDYMSKSGMHIFEAQKSDISQFEYQLPNYFSEHPMSIWPMNYIFDQLIQRFFIEVPLNIHTIAAGLKQNHVFLKIRPCLLLCYAVSNRIQNINVMRKKFN